MAGSFDLDRLVESAKDAVQHAYAPYSMFKVAAAVVFESGIPHIGCNVENASYGLTVCAERTAIARAICMGERTLQAVAIASSGDGTPYPCGACLQVMMEFAAEDEPVFLYLVSGTGVEVRTLDEVLPYPFKLR